MKNYFLLINLCLAISASSLFGQTGSIKGVVTDSLTGQPVAGLSVFIPSTTFGTSTNQKGEYHLDKLNPGDYTLEFRHLSYPLYTRPISISEGKEMVLNMVIAEQSRKLKEFVIRGKVPDRRLGIQYLREYFLGDNHENLCKILNPLDISFYYDGDVIKAIAKKPLQIVNKHLGYRITYFLDYFRYAEDKNPDPEKSVGAYFGYSGSALFEDLSAGMPLSTLNSKINRANEFKGSIRHFLASLYVNELQVNHYQLRKAYRGLKDLQNTEKQSMALSKIKLAQMDSLFNWDPVSGKSEYLFYDPAEEFNFNEFQVKDGPKAGEKILATDYLLLVFSDFRRTKDLLDDRITSLRLPDGGITFDKDGNYWAPNGGLSWINLLNTILVKSMLPDDYMPKIVVTNESK